VVSEEARFREIRVPDSLTSTTSLGAARRATHFEQIAPN
jgi:hypothetical protein